jgi:hypothetical protein
MQRAADLLTANELAAAAEALAGLAAGCVAAGAPGWRSRLCLLVETRAQPKPGPGAAGAEPGGRGAGRVITRDEHGGVLPAAAWPRP